MKLSQLSNRELIALADAENNAGCQAILKIAEQMLTVAKGSPPLLNCEAIRNDYRYVMGVIETCEKILAAPRTVRDVIENADKSKETGQ